MRTVFEHPDACRQPRPEACNRPRRRLRPDRRGVTLLEMMVVVALIVLMMVILVQIFSVATGAISTTRTLQELDNSLRLLDRTIRTDLNGATANMTPGQNDPLKNQGYLEYAENAFADFQGEDTDDTLALTVQAPENQPFTGRVFVPSGIAPASALPITITSTHAEVIYFLRAGNLYRRVLLIAPERQRSVSFTLQTWGGFTQNALFGNKLAVSWQGLNDLSARPSALPANINNAPILNTLGDLTNRENRFARPRFANDFFNVFTNSAGTDGIADDRNGDFVHDYYPTLYPNAVNDSASRTPYNSTLYGKYFIVNEDPTLGTNTTPARASSPLNQYQIHPFPFIYPWAYSVPDSVIQGTSSNLGLIHGIGYVNAASQYITNHAPLDIGEDPQAAGFTQVAQTWWGFPTWRETMSPNWLDPFVKINGAGQGVSGRSGGALNQAVGLQPFDPSTAPGSLVGDPNRLPPLNPALQYVKASTAQGQALGALKILSNPVPFQNDGAGSSSFLMPYLNSLTPAGALAQVPPGESLNPNMVWEDDLLMTGVRSFDIKAYDQPPNALPAGYYDLGYGSDLTNPNNNNAGVTLSNNFGNGSNLQFGFSSVGAANFLLPSFAHEGRIPPLEHDFRFDAQAAAAQPPMFFPLGDDRPTVIRLRRVFDTWSTAYMNATASTQTSNQWGFPYNGRPVYPSYPPPYPGRLRGLQIQIRVVDPRNQKVKVLTLRHQF